jgi:DNA polymerase (family 10)
MSRDCTNAEVAGVFSSIAEMLERQGENPFKIRAYRKAVETLEYLNEPVSEVNLRGELRQLPGFGEAIASKTQEILATGTCELFERLKTEQAGAAQKIERSALNSQTSTDDEEMPSPW